MKIGDFGIAKVLSAKLQKAKTYIGTIYYESPEMVQNKPYSFSTDVWSMGVMLYEMCMQKRPFDGESVIMVYIRIVGGAYDPISSSYSSELRKLINKCLTKDPSKRPTVKEILKMSLIKNYI